MRNMTEMKKKKLAIMMAFRRVEVALLMLTAGVYVGVKVRSEDAAPSALSSFWAFFSCLRAANDLNVGRVMLIATSTQAKINRASQRQEQ